MSLFKQKRTHSFWGYIVHIIGQLGIITQLVTLVISIVTLASVLQLRGIMVPTWLVGLLTFAIIISAGAIVFKRGLPSYFSAWNQQWWEHNNPMRKELEKINKRLARIEGNHHEEHTSKTLQHKDS